MEYVKFEDTTKSVIKNLNRRTDNKKKTLREKKRTNNDIQNKHYPENKRLKGKYFLLHLLTQYSISCGCHHGFRDNEATEPMLPSGLVEVII